MRVISHWYTGQSCVPIYEREGRSWYEPHVSRKLVNDGVNLDPLVPVYYCPWTANTLYVHRRIAKPVALMLEFRDYVVEHWSRHCFDIAMIREGDMAPWPSFLRFGWTMTATSLWVND